MSGSELTNIEFSLPRSMTIREASQISCELKKILAALPPNAPVLSLQGSDVHVCSTAGAQLLAAVDVSVTRKGGKIEIKQPSAQLQESLAVLGFSYLLHR